MGLRIWPKDWPINMALADQRQKNLREGVQHRVSRDQGTRTPWIKLRTWTWATPVTNVGTDTRQFDELGWKAKTGAMTGAGIPFIAKRLQEEDYAVHMMFSAVAGSILEYKLFRGRVAVP